MGAALATARPAADVAPERSPPGRDRPKPASRRPSAASFALALAGTVLQRSCSACERERPCPQCAAAAAHDAGRFAGLSVAPANDPLEREANRLVDLALRPAAGVGHEGSALQPAAPRAVQRRCPCGGVVRDGGECAECRARRLQREQTPSVPTGGEPAPQSVADVVSSAGQPLAAPVRTFMEGRLGADFGSVRVHTDGRAAESAEAVGARAYTVGDAVVFGAGEYAPESEAGRGLIAHELVHVLQQRAGRVALQRQAPAAPPSPPPVPCDATVVGPGSSSAPVNVLFGSEDTGLDAGDTAAIDAFAASWTAAGGTTNVFVDGYASQDGPVDLNWRLSCDRANAVKARLVAKGVPAGRITTLAHGESTQFAPTALGPNRRATIDQIAAPAPPPPAPAAPACPAVPTATPGSCLGRNAAYCAAAVCFPTNRWLPCVCGASADVCRAVEAFTFASTEGVALFGCIELAHSMTPTMKGLAQSLTISKGVWLRSTNTCIWGHWQAALEAIHDPSRPVPTTLTPEWAAAVRICRASGVGSSDCCRAHVEAEQHAIDRCGPYDSRRFGPLPTDVPLTPVCSAAVAAGAPGPPFTGDFGLVADRIAYGVGPRCRC